MPIFKQVAVLVLHLPHDLHGSPFVHLVSQLILVAVGIPVLAMSKGVTIEFTGNGLATHIGPDDALIMDEAFHNWHHMRVLRTDIHHQRTLQSEEVSGQHWGLMHEQSIELVLLKEEFDQFLTVLLAAQWWLDIEQRMLRGIHQQLLCKCRASESLEALPIIDEAILQYTLRVTIFSCEGVVEVEFDLFSGGLVDLYVLNGLQLTEGATTSGRSLPAKPIFVFSEPTYMISGMP